MNYGRIKFRLGRLQSYFTMVASTMSFLAAMKILGISYLWCVIGLPVIYILHLFDKRVVHPQESATMFSDNPEWNKLVGQMNELRKHNMGEAQDSLATRIEQQVQIDEAERLLRSYPLSHSPKSVGHRLAKLYRGELGDNGQHDGRSKLRTQRTTGAI